MELVPEKYKQIDIGLIPSDWDVAKLELITDIKTGPFGSSLHQRDYVSDGTPIITVEHLGEQRIVHRNLPMVSEYDRRRLISYAIKTGDIVFSRVGSVDRNSIVSENENGWLFSGRLLRIRINQNNIEAKYLSYHLHQESVKKRIRNVAVGQTMASLNTQILKAFEVVIPPTKSEQTAIATALSDTDNYISSLGKLITKKRLIKQGTMQQLLTPKGNWVVKKFGEVLKVRHGKSQKAVVSDNGDYPVLASGGVIGKAKVFLYDKPSVLIGRKGTIDEPQYLETPFWSVDTLFYTEVFEKYDAKFIFYMFSLIDWYSYNEASGVPSLNAKTIELIEKHFPPSKSEQEDIVFILNDIDKEIAVLEKQLTKAYSIKEGIMQQLLTGKIRLI